MTETEKEICARITMLEFVLETMWASNLAYQSEDESKETKRQFSEASKKSYGPMTADKTLAHELVDMAEMVSKSADHFMKKVSRREIELRPLIKDRK
jgi:hypothetical protein